MHDSFEIPVTYKGEELLFPATLNSFGYSYKIIVDVYGKHIAFEPDEERNFRAVISMEELHDSGKIEKELLQQIAQSIESIIK